MEILVAWALAATIAFVITLVRVFLVNADLKQEKRDVAYYKKWAYESDGKADEERAKRWELRKVLATTILGNHNNYLGIDPDTFDALPEDFAIFKSADTGSDGDHNILVYQVGPRVVGGVKLQNAIL